MDKVKNRDVFETLPIRSAVLKMAVPTIMSQLIILIYNMADTFFIGRTNNPYMVAGTSLVLPLFNISTSLSNLAGVGGGSLLSRLLGKGDTDEAKATATFSMLLSGVLALLFSLIIILFGAPILRFLGAGDDTFAYARTYSLCVIGLGAFPTVMANTLANLVRSTGESKKAGNGLMLGGILNMILDPIFMFLVFRGNPILGAGLATCLSNIISTLFFVVIIGRLGKDSVLAFRKPERLPRKDSISAIFGVGFPSAIAMFLFDLDYMVIGRLMTGYGAIEMAAIGIVLKVERLPLNIGIGIASGMMPLVAYNYASGNRKRMDGIVSFARNLGVVSAILSILIYQAFAKEIMGFFISDASTVAIGTTFLRIRILATPLMYLSFFHVYLFNGFGKGDKALFLGAMRWLVFNIPMLYLLNALIGMYGIVWAQITADVFTVALSFYVYWRYRKTQM